MTFNLDQLIEKRREITGGDGRTFPVEFGGEIFNFVAPDLASSEWIDKHAAIKDDIRDGLIDEVDARLEMLELYLGDQAQAFIDAADAAGIDAGTLAGWVMQERAEEVGKTRGHGKLNRSQRRANRH